MNDLKKIDVGNNMIGSTYYLLWVQYVHKLFFKL